MIIWVPKTYPYQSPTCFVTPTKDMVIKQNHRSVDPNGQCYAPYIQDWSTSSNLVGLIASLCSVFSKEPPLFSTASAGGRPQTSHATFKNPKPLPPPPAANTSGIFTPITMPAPIPLPTSNPPPPVSIPINNVSTTARGSGNQKNELLRQTTQLLQRKLDEFFKTTTNDMDMFMSNQSTLQQRSAELDKIVQALQQDEVGLENTVAAGIAKGEEMDHWILQLEQPRDIDEVVTPEDPLSNQLLNLIAEDNSLEDVLYYLGKGLAAGKLDLDAYLKEVRSISRQQFFARALAMKVNSMLANDGRQ